MAKAGSTGRILQAVARGPRPSPSAHRWERGSTRSAPAPPAPDTAAGPARTLNARVPGVEVADRLGAPAAGGVAVGGDQVAQRRLAGALAAALGVAEEEALVAGQAVDHRRRAAVQRGAIGVVGGGEAGEIGDILAQRQLAVEVETGEGLVGVVLADQRLAGLAEMGEVRGGPPVAQPPLGVELGAEIVEAVADLVADHRADRAVIVGRVGGAVVEGRLEDAGREVHRVLQRQVDRVHGVRAQPPFAAVDRLAELGELVAIFELLRAPGIAEGVVGADLERRIIAPALRIADADGDGLDLAARLGERRRAPSSEAGQAAVEGLDDVADHRLHVGLGRGGEVALDVDLADRVDQRAAGRGDGAALARALLLLAGEDAAVEGEAQIVIGLRQHAAKRLAVWKASQSFQTSSGSLPTRAEMPRERLRMPGDDLSWPESCGGLEEGVPVDAGRAGRRNRRGARSGRGAGPARRPPRHGRGRSWSRDRRCAGRAPRHRPRPSGSASGRYRRDRRRGPGPLPASSER